VNDEREVADAGSLRDAGGGGGAGNYSLCIPRTSTCTVLLCGSILWLRLLWGR